MLKQPSWQAVRESRLFGFARFLYQRFNEVDVPQVSASLTFTSLLALVPVLTVALVILSAFPVFDDLSSSVIELIDGYLVPQGADAVRGYLATFQSNAGNLTAIGIVFLGVTAVMLIRTIDQTFNRIWRAQDRRPLWTQFLVYWMLLTFAPLAVGAGLSVWELLLRHQEWANQDTRLSDGIKNRSIKPIGEMLSEKSFVNAIIGLMATGGSTNHTMHLVAMARAAGIILNWDDFDDISAIVPLLIRVYPNGQADVNHFAAAGGLPFVIRELLDAGLLHDDVDTVVGRGMRAYTQEPFLIEGRLKWQDAVAESRDTEVLRPVSAPFSPDGGLRVMKGNIGRGVIKVSAVKDHCRIIEAPAIVFDDQKEVLAAFERGELERDFVCVVRFQGPRANGMPELHKLTPPLAILQDRGFQVALVTDGRMSGASGKVPAAIHMSPETLLGGGIGKIRTGDIIRFNSHTGELTALVDEAEWNGRETAAADLSGNRHGIGRELFAGFRSITGSAETGAMSLGGDFG